MGYYVDLVGYLCPLCRSSCCSRLFLNLSFILGSVSIYDSKNSTEITYLQNSWLICRSIQISIEVDFRIIPGHLPRLFPRIPSFRESVLYLGLRNPDLNQAPKSVLVSIVARDVAHISKAACTARDTYRQITLSSIPSSGCKAHSFSLLNFCCNSVPLLAAYIPQRM